MESRRDKLKALLQFGAQVADDPMLQLLVGFLAGQVDRVHFVRSLDGATIGVRVALGRRAVWPARGFHATVRGVPVPVPAALVSVLSETSDPIALQVVFDGMEGALWLQKVLHDDLAEATRAPEARRADDLAALRARIDQALDVYNECRRLLEDGDPAREKELRFFLDLARREIESLGAEFQRLRAGLDAGR
ncbi:MAG: hypothetical protein IRZ11_03230 [Clostridia bacterium]|nr:hypothetical protein [Clostridia bacterium]